MPSSEKTDRLMMLYCASLVVVTTTCLFVMAAFRVQQEQHPSFLYNLSWMNMKALYKPKIRGRSDIHQQYQQQQVTSSLLQTTLCADRCESDCVVYKTPWMTCYNGQHLFPSDPSWSEWDILDIPLVSTVMTTPSSISSGKKDDDINASPLVLVASFRRFFFSTQNASCINTPTDIYTLPLNACLGPFGAPRPWGNFTTTGTTTTTIT